MLLDLPTLLYMRSVHFFFVQLQRPNALHHYYVRFTSTSTWCSRPYIFLKIDVMCVTLTKGKVKYRVEESNPGPPQVRGHHNH